MKHTILLTAMLATGFVTQAFAQSTTFSVDAYPILGNTQVAADFNGDGRPDLAGAGGTAVSIMMNNGNGTFAQKVDLPISTWTQDVTTGDFNGDGKIDLAVSLQDSQLGLAVLLGSGAGTFGAPTYYANPSGFDEPYLLAGDINNDAKLDIVIMHGVNCFTASCVPSTIVSVMLGNGDGTFQPARDIQAGTHPTAIAFGDFNRDGIKDLAVGGGNTELSILMGVGDGTFVLKLLMLLVDGGDVASCNDVDVADFNRDGIDDIVVPLGNGDGNVVLLGNGDGTFRVFTRYLDEAVSAPQSDAIADFNGDGFLDIARGMADSLRSGLVQVLHGNGDGTFQPIVKYAVPSTLTNQGGGYLIAADFNGDSKPDLALEVRGSGGTDIFLNRTGSTTTQPAPTLQSLVMNPASIVVPNWGTGVVTLSGTAQSPTTVQLKSNNSNVSIPTSVTVSTGTRSVSFNIIPRQVNSVTSVQITATSNNVSRSATLTVYPSGTAAPSPTPAPPPPPTPAPSATPAPTAAPVADTVSITRAEYESAKSILRIEASSSKSTATLQVYVTSTNQLIGTLTNNGGGKYSGQFTSSANPQNVTVRSSLGGSKSGTVAPK
ncbi:MAG TPA: VCBS repeat-containing protein [Chthoniobacterales bacterium]|nr:VCBS repeat-containing protein [Chthoniobacterales bacterium]